MLASTIVWWGRNLSPEEINRLMSASDIEFDTGRSFGAIDKKIEYDGKPAFIRQWINEEVATTWVEFLNTFSPPPVIALVQPTEV